VPNRQPLAPRKLDARPLLRQAVAPGHVRIGPLMATPSVLAELGIAPEPLLAELDLDLAAFTDPEHRVPYRTVAQLFDRCAEATSCHHFGLLVGSRAGLSSLGVVGYLASSAPNVGTALEILRQLNSVADAGGTVTLDCRETIVSLGYDVVEPGLEHTGQLAAAAIAIAFNILRSLCGPQWQPHHVQFSFAAPRAVVPFRKVFGLAPRFDQECSAIAFPARWLANPPPGADPILHRMMKDRIDELLADNADDVVGRVRRLLRATVTTRRASIDDAAATLRISTHAEASPCCREHVLPAVARRGAVRARLPAAARYDDSDRPDRFDRGLLGKQRVQQGVQAVGRSSARRVAAHVGSIPIIRSTFPPGCENVSHPPPRLLVLIAR
jgi:Arabinose-binding domain of AraC transcription regulator, N-term